MYYKNSLRKSSSSSSPRPCNSEEIIRRKKKKNEKYTISDIDSCVSETELSYPLNLGCYHFGIVDL